jgi:hypothetical protein
MRTDDDHVAKHAAATSTAAVVRDRDAGTTVFSPTVGWPGWATLVVDVNVRTETIADKDFVASGSYFARSGQRPLGRCGSLLLLDPPCFEPRGTRPTRRRRPVSPRLCGS